MSSEPHKENEEKSGSCWIKARSWIFFLNMVVVVPLCLIVGGALGDIYLRYKQTWCTEAKGMYVTINDTQIGNSFTTKTLTSSVSIPALPAKCWSDTNYVIFDDPQL